MAGAQPLILMYHRVGTYAVDPRRLAVSPARFAEQIDIVAANCRPIALGEMARAMRTGTLADDAVAITFDDGYAANIAHALPALRAHSVPATMFVTSGYVGGAREFWWDELERILLLPGTLPAELPVLADGQMQTVTLGDSARYSEEDARCDAGWRMDDGVDPTPRHQLYRRFHKRLMSVVAETDRLQIVAALADWAGRVGEVRDSHRQMTAAEIDGLGEDALIEIGGHTMTHPVLAHLPAAAQTQEIRDGKAALEAMAGCTIDTFAYPFGGIDTFTGETVELLRREGFVCAATTVQSTINARTDPYRLPRVMVRDWTGEDFAQRIGATLSARTTTPAPAQVPAQPVKPDGATAPPDATVLGGQARAATTVLLFTDSHSFCGIGQKSAVLLEALLGAGYRVVCAQRHEATPLQDRLSELGVEYVWFETNPDDDKQAFALDRVTPARIFATIQPDLIVFANGRPMGSYSAKAAAAFLSIPYIIIEATTARKLLPKASESELRDTTVAQYLDARAVVTVCQENLDNLKSALSLPLGFGQVIYQGPGEAFFAPADAAKRQQCRDELGLADDAVLCFTAATLERVKGYDIQFSAIKTLRDQPIWNSLYFAWAGEGPLRPDLEVTIAKLDLADRVILLGQRWEVSPWLDAADIFVLPSYSEGLPAAVVEAMAKGVPVAATNVGGVAEGLGDCGRLLAPPTDPGRTATELAETIALWAADGDLRRGIGEAGRARARANFSQAGMTDELLGLVDGVVGDIIAARS